jgi:UDP-3-O-[3-hydroxymyristoyl] glucosamine N-acyltransferase
MKYKLTKNKKTIKEITLYQIEALKDFSDIKKGDLGGWIEKESNLSQQGDCWVSCRARVYGRAMVCDNAQVSGDAWVYGRAMVCDNAQVSGDAIVSGNARVSGDAIVSGNARVFGDAMVYGDAWVYGDVRVSGNAIIT